MSLVSSRKCMMDEMSKILTEESKIDDELSQYFEVLKKSKTGNILTSSKFGSLDIFNHLSSIEKSNSGFDAMLEDSKKLINQIDEGKLLSDRLNYIVRRLDTIQIRSQQALACTEDIINMKECKVRLCSAIESKNLVVAVGCIRQVREIDVKAAQSSDDYELILQKEKELKDMVRNEFNTSITNEDINAVMSLCPLLQTLNLETEARDSFLLFVENSIFSSISADLASAAEGTTTESIAYAQALSKIFNDAYLIIQKYLPMVIAGMENSHGDVHFIRQLHTRVEIQAGLVLKRYMKFRSMTSLLQFFDNSQIINSSTSGEAKMNSGDIKASWSIGEVHSAMDELALLIQYCSRYSQFLQHVCNGAENKVRHQGGLIVEKVVIFSGPTSFDRMKDELVNKYYCSGERWLMRNGIRNAMTNAATHVDDSGLDECFFVLQKCGMRAIATNDIGATLAVLHNISELVSSDLLTQGAELVMSAANKVSSVVTEHISQYKRSITNSAVPSEVHVVDISRGSSTLSSGFQNAMSLATSTISGSSSIGGGGPLGGGTMSVDKADIQFHALGGFWLAGRGNSVDDPWGVAESLESFNMVELSARYTERLGKDLWTSGQTVFANNDANNSVKKNDNQNSASVKSTISSKSAFDRLRLSKEDFDTCSISFQHVIRQGAEKLTGNIHSAVKDIFSFVLDRGGSFGGVRFDEQDSLFDNQPALNQLPKALVLPFETIVNICTFQLHDKTKDTIVGLLVDIFCEKCEQFIFQNTFSFAGALKLDEIIRALSSMFMRYSTVPIRGKFSRLREVIQVLTMDSVSTSSKIQSGRDSFSLLSTNEIDALLTLRKDLQK